MEPHEVCYMVSFTPRGPEVLLWCVCVRSQCHAVVLPVSVPHWFVLDAEDVSSFGQSFDNIRVEVFVETSILNYFG